MITLLFIAICFLAYSNGANDNFKGVASLFGSRTCNYRTAIGWATITTGAGSIAAIFLAQSLLKKFSGKGLVPDARPDRRAHRRRPRDRRRQRQLRRPRKKLRHSSSCFPRPGDRRGRSHL